MAGNNPRKFKDRIALLNQKQAESTEQFEVSSVILIKRWESEIYKLEKLLPPLKNFKIEGKKLMIWLLPQIIWI